MIRKAWALALALTGALLISVSGASPAQAAVPELHCTSSTFGCIVQATGTDNTFTFGSGGEFNVVCSGPEVKTTLASKTTTTLAIEPVAYSKCSIKFTLASAAVNMNGCKYLLHLQEGKSPYPFGMDLVCPPGQKVTITYGPFACTISLSSQIAATGGTMANSGGEEPTDVQLTFKATGLTYTVAGPECFRLPGTYTDGRYSGTLTLKGFNDAEGAAGANVGLHVY